MAEGLSLDLGQKLGYYIIAFFILSALFVLMVGFIGGIRTQYYKSNYGEGIIGFESTIFNCVAYRDPLTMTRNSRIIDLDTFTTFNLNSCLLRPAEVRLILFDSNRSIIHESQTTSFREHDILKKHPVIIRNDSVLFGGELHIFIRE